MMSKFIEIFAKKSEFNMLESQTPYNGIMNESEQVVVFDQDNEPFITDKYDLEKNGFVINIL